MPGAPIEHRPRSCSVTTRRRRRTVRQRSLSIREKHLGPEHLETAVALEGLGYHEYALGNLTAAYELIEHSLEIQIRVLGDRARRLGKAYYNLACINALTGNRRAALDGLQLALDTGWSWYGADADSDLDSLRGDPEFEAMMEEVRRRVEAAR